jgi:serine/threonine protein phosphatase 1
MGKMNRFVIGDVHGGLKALKQCIERAGADIKKDEFIFLGDVADGWPEVKECVDYILTMKHVEYILGNHDEWLLTWMKTGVAPYIWTSQGGEATLESYRKDGIPDSHIRFFEKANLFLHYDDDLFVHGGLERGTKAEDTPRDILLWDRELATKSANCAKFDKSDLARPHYKRIFVGHTTTTCFRRNRFDGKINSPIYGGHVWNLDTGGGWEGKLTIMDVDTEKWWQSDFVYTLYPNCKGRR